MSDEFNIDDIIAEERAAEAAEAEARARAAAQRAAAEKAAARKARVVMGLDDDEDEKPVKQAKPEKSAKPKKAARTPAKSEKAKPKKEADGSKKKSGKKGKLPKWAIVLICIVAALAIIAAFVAFVIYADFYMVLYAELGDGAPKASDFLKDGRDASYIGTPDVSLTEEDSYLLTVKAGDTERKVLLIVRDTEAPTATSLDPVITIDDTISPEDALENISDASKYTVEWKTIPDFGKAGVYGAEILLCDEHDNSRTLNVKVTILGAIDVLTYEAGDPHPTLADFMVVERDDAKLLTDLGSAVKWDVPGEYKVEIGFDGKTYESIVKVVDTTPPVPDVVTAAVLKDGSVKPEDFILGCDDATAVEYEFTEAPSTGSIGTSYCTIKATDLGGNETEVKAALIVCSAIGEIEAANETVTESRILGALGSEYSYCTFTGSLFSLTELGAHEVQLMRGSESITAAVVVKDTTPPTAAGISYSSPVGCYIEPINYVSDISDVSRVKASFITEPDWDTEGSYEVEIRLTDRGGNVTDIKATAVIEPDTTAPVIYAAKDRTCYVGEAVAYFKEVFAEDNADPEPTLTVDKSKVDYKTAGTYPVTYTAVDKDGNSASVTVNFTFVEQTIDKDTLDAAIEEVFDEIFIDNMTPTEQAYAIFKYCRNHILYTGTSDKTDLYGEAYRGIKQGVGDCYTFYAVSYCMLEKIDCQVLSVERLNGKTQHFWCLVNLGTGWYHFDTCNVGPQHYECFMKMTSDLTPLSEQYWRFDQSLYPPVETTPFVAPD